MSYQITKEIRLHSEEDDWFYQFIDDGEGNVEVAPYTTHGIEERKSGDSFYIPKDCIDDFVKILQELK